MGYNRISHEPYAESALPPDEPHGAEAGCAVLLLVGGG